MRGRGFFGLGRSAHLEDGTGFSGLEMRVLFLIDGTTESGAVVILSFDTKDVESPATVSGICFLITLNY